jgi:F-type H+-transporting ATPase subunit b
MNINATLFAQTAVFLILAWVMMKFIWPPLMHALDARTQKIADGLSAAEKGKAELAAATVRITQELALANEQAKQKIAAAEARAQVAAEEIRQNAAREAERLIADAKAHAEQQFLAARLSLRSEAATLAVKGAEQILKREIDPAAHADLLKQLEAQC